jgi:hypothetical protein
MEVSIVLEDSKFGLKMLSNAHSKVIALTQVWNFLNRRKHCSFIAEFNDFYLLIVSHLMLIRLNGLSERSEEFGLGIRFEVFREALNKIH